MTTNVNQQAKQQQQQQKQKPSRLKVLRSEDNGKCATFELDQEDHTLGNALRHIILKNPEVKFCGYALPHPNERKVNIQIQVYSGVAIDALEKGFRDLVQLNKIVKEKILEAKEEFGPVEFVDTDEEDLVLEEEEDGEDDVHQEGEKELVPEQEKPEEQDTSNVETAADQVPMISDENW